MFSTIAIIIILPVVVAMMAMTIINIRGGESGAASGRGHGGATKKKLRGGEKKNSIFWGLRSFGSYWPFHVFSLTAIPCRMHRISFDLRS